jgi:hypothetical protein
MYFMSLPPVVAMRMVNRLSSIWMMVVPVVLDELLNL